MKFSIITPSFRNSRWLKLCIPSVADQGVEHEHIVQDSCSDDGTQDWLPQDRRVTAIIEKDRGMYDAVNRGFQRARGDILAYINCDEQYLPGALRTVSEFFDRHPDVDVVFGDSVIVGPEGDYICERNALVPHRLHTLVSYSLSYLTAATFLRRRVITETKVLFDPSLRDVGDAEWTLRLIQAGVKMARLRAFTSTFTETGHNMNLGANAAREKQAFSEKAPQWARKLAPLIVAHFRLRRLAAGHYFRRPHAYAIYTPDSPDQRVTFQVTRPTALWRSRLSPALGGGEESPAQPPRSVRVRAGGGAN